MIIPIRDLLRGDWVWEQNEPEIWLWLARGLSYSELPIAISCLMRSL